MKAKKLLLLIMTVSLLVTMLFNCTALEEDLVSSEASSEEAASSAEISDTAASSAEASSSESTEDGSSGDTEDSSVESIDSSEPDSSAADSSVPDSSVADSSEPDTSSRTDTNDKKEGLYYTPDPLVKDDNTKYVAFTFDDGPSQHTETLLNYLEEKGIVITFFYVGNRLDGNDKYGAYVKRAVDIGCEPAIHCYTHDNYFHSCSDSVYEYEVEKTAEVIYHYAGCYPITMRPPGGSITAERAAESDYNIIIWSVDSNDWKYKTPSSSNIETIKNNILGDFENNPDCLDGKIVLLHDLYENSVTAFMEIVDMLLEEGYQFVTVSQLCELDSSTTVGKRYYSETYAQ